VNPFQADGLWLRCALHAHTTNSDGELAPDLLVRHHEWAGYDVLAITDHWVRTAEPSTKKLLVIPSTELNANAPTQEHDAHVLALGLTVDPVLPEGNFAPLEEVVAWITENGGVPYLAHTY
jgi:predicted metal-dependent phosphoesterase TrpH